MNAEIIGALPGTPACVTDIVFVADWPLAVAVTVIVAVRCEMPVFSFGVMVMVRVTPVPLTDTVQILVFDDAAVTVAFVGDTVAVTILLFVSLDVNDNEVTDSVSVVGIASNVTTTDTSWLILLIVY